MLGWFLLSFSLKFSVFFCFYTSLSPLFFFFRSTVSFSIFRSMVDEIGYLFNKVFLDDGLCTNHQSFDYSLIGKMIMKMLDNLEAMKFVFSRV